MDVVITILVSLSLICLSYVISTLDDVNAKIDQVNTKLFYLTEEEEEENEDERNESR